MQYISSDTSVWIDFSTIDRLGIPFLLPYTYIMSNDAIEDELLSPSGLGDTLKSFGLLPVEITYEEFALAENYGNVYIRLSKYDRIALAIAKTRDIILLTGDGALRKAAKIEGVTIMGTLGILDQLKENELIDVPEYRYCLQSLLDNNGMSIRLPKSEIQSRLDATL